MSASSKSTTDDDENTSSNSKETKSRSRIIIRNVKPQRATRLSDKSSFQCWAHSRSGKRCSKIVKPREGECIPVPYCNVHLKSGDGALRVIRHPIAGKCLVARFPLPPNYRIAFHGKRGKCRPCDKEDRAISFYPPNPQTGKNRNRDGKIITNNYNGVLNPDQTGDLIQYASCPGPNERQNMSTFQYWGKRNGTYGGLEFLTLEEIPANTQLCHWYGSGWWSARGIKRVNVGLGKYPAPKRIPSKGNEQDHEI